MQEASVPTVPSTSTHLWGRSRAEANRSQRLGCRLSHMSSWGSKGVVLLFSWTPSSRESQILCMWSKGLLQQAEHHFYSQIGKWRMSWHESRREMQDTSWIRMIEFTSALMLRNNWLVIQSPNLIPAVHQGYALSSQGSMSCQSSEQSCTRLAKVGLIGSNKFLRGGKKKNKIQNHNTAWCLC